jgi:hypothetical protein
MYELDHMLNGKGSRQHHQDILQLAQHQQLVSEAEAAQRSQKTEMSYPGIARRSLAALLNFVTAPLTILRRSAHGADANEMVQANEQDFAQASSHR